MPGILLECHAGLVIMAQAKEIGFADGAVCEGGIKGNGREKSQTERQKQKGKNARGMPHEMNLIGSIRRRRTPRTGKVEGEPGKGLEAMEGVTLSGGGRDQNPGGRGRHPGE